VINTVESHHSQEKKVEVEARIPKGGALKMSGVSIATPAATNLAAKLLAVNPELTPMKIIDLILKGASVSQQDSVLLLNPLNTIAIMPKMKEK
jgi:subtilisin family serine protease